MPWSPDNSLVIGISSRAILNLDREHQVYEEHGVDAFIRYQREHEDEILDPGVGFRLVESLLKLNGTLSLQGHPESVPIEIVILSKNHPDCAVRIHQSLLSHQLEIKRAVFTGGQDILPHLRALKVDLFLSKEVNEVERALSENISAGLIYGGPAFPGSERLAPVIAFDGDSVLFSAEADHVYMEHKLEGFKASEQRNARTPLPNGPLHRFATALEEIRKGQPTDTPPFRIALVTARDFTCSERPIRTLREQGIRVDQAFFVSDMPKSVVLDAIRPLIFFDDSQKNCDDAARQTFTVKVPTVENPGIVQAPIRPAKQREERFTQICKLYLKKSFDGAEPDLLLWHEEKLAALDNKAASAFLSELERSVAGTPATRQRRAGAAKNVDAAKLFLFLDNLFKKHKAVGG